MKSLLFRRILFSYIIFTFLLVVFLELYLSTIIKDNYIAKLRENLIIQANLIAEQIPSSLNKNLDDFCRRYKEKTGARITIIDGSGRVLGDSDEPSENMENHYNRPEIRDAALSGSGSSIMFSKTLQKDLFYLAITIDRNTSKNFLRLSVPLHDIEKAMNSVRMRIIIASLTSLSIIILIGIIQGKRITKTIEEIMAYTKEASSGNIRRHLLLKGRDELAELAVNISDMAQELNERLRQVEEEKIKMEAILRNMSDGLILVDTKGKILLINPSAKAFFGIESDFMGKTIMETLRKSALVESIEYVLKNQQTVSLEIEINYPKKLYLFTTVAPFLIRDEISGVVILFHDITKLKQLEDIRRDFVANVSHEIKTPITAIKGFAETLIEGAIDDRENAPKFLEAIKNHSERLNSLVSDLLTLSRIELGDIVIHKEELNIDDIIDTVFAILRDRARNKGLYLRKDISPEVQKIYADKDRLIQILLNLVDNGIKFTETGGVIIKVQRAESREQRAQEPSVSSIIPHPLSFVIISVEDSGIGIPKNHIPRLGERFYRVDRARSRELGGTGLGLAIVKHLIKAHGWKMEIESTQGKGTTVKIIIPTLTKN
ncbi:MAG: PAS domain S-box protein [Nitrospirae bacterium]|nr:PAS domain S-box protein [Nitrospirota bacterium]